MVLIDIIIKAPNQKLEDQTFECDLEWTVHRLKTHLSSVYPTKPRIEDQRLIYSGHLLKNEQSLRDILQPIDNNLTFTIHMVCSQSLQNTPKHTSNTMAANNSNNNNTNDSSNNENNNSSTQSPNPENNTRNDTNPNVFQNPMNGQFLPNINSFYANPLNMNSPTVVIPPDQMWQQMAAFQQAYAQYMAQYFTQNPYINPTQITAPVLPEMAQMAAPQPVINAGPEAAIPAVNAPVPQAPPVQRLNAGPGAQQVIDDEDEARNRDWLDCFYWMSRAVVLFSIIYFYSSFTRFLLVVFLSVLLYVYQTKWFNRRQQINNNNNNILQQNIVNNNNNNEIRVNREEQEPNEANDDTEVLDRPQLMANNSNTNDGRVTEERFTGLRFVWVIVSSLFTSLIPENPAVPVNIN